MKKIIIAVILTFTFTTFAIHAVEQTAFKGAGIIESTSGGFKFPDGTVQTTAADTALAARVAALEALLANVSRGPDPDTGYDTLLFEAMNVQIVNGEGVTNSSIGTGNLIIGYNEPRDENNATDPCPSDWATEFWCNRRTGSHMLVLGGRNNYTSYGGIVAGHQNETVGAYSSVSGGVTSFAIGYLATVSGGNGNRASSSYASVSGGQGNLASGNSASVSGGHYNTASADYASISGGHHNTASSNSASVSSGQYNTASADYASISGGYHNTASGNSASVSGGQYNTASGDYASVTGGNSKIAVTNSCIVGDDGVDC